MTIMIIMIEIMMMTITIILITRAQSVLLVIGLWLRSALFG